MSKNLTYIHVGCLPENWTLDNLLGKHASVPYNPNIASVFYYAGFIESWGRGIEKIRNACEMDGVPMPEYTVNPGDIMIKFTAPEDRIVSMTKEVTDGVTDQEERTLKLLYEDPGFTTAELTERLGVSRKSVLKYLKSLREKKIIERVGTNKRGYWKIKK